MPERNVPISVPPSANAGTTLCRHRGIPTGETIPCGPTKKCHQRVYGCELHTRCTIGLTQSEVISCIKCPDFDSIPLPAAAPGAILSQPMGGVLVTLNIGGVLSSHVRASHEAAAARWHVDYEAIDTRRLPESADPRWEKVNLEQWAKERAYARVAYVDADVLIRSDAPSLFVVTPPGRIGLVANDQLPGPHWRTGLANVSYKSLAIWGVRLGEEVTPSHLVPNSGVMVWDVGLHSHLWDQWYAAGSSAQWKRLGGWTDQAALSILLWKHYEEGLICWLPCQYNLLVHRPDMVSTEGRAPAYLTHFAGQQAKARIPACQWNLRPNRPQSVSPHPTQKGGESTGAPLGPGADSRTELGRRVVITLSKRGDRLKAFEEAFPGRDADDVIDIQYAVDGSLAAPPTWWQHGPGQWGARQSHLRVIENALLCEWDRITVFEDDADPCPDFERRLNAWLTHVPSDWELLFLGGQTLRHTAVAVNEHVLRPGYTILAHAYALRGKGLRLAYQWGHDPQIERSEFDHRLAALSASGQIRAYAPTCWLVYQRAGWSDIRQCDRPLRGVGGPLSGAGVIGRGGENE